MVKKEKRKSKIQGIIYGTAIGDGLGYPTEFKTMDEIFAKWGKDGIQEPEGNPILVTDDTQMGIYTYWAIKDYLEEIGEEKDNPDVLTQHIDKRFREWYHDPENNRAPGMTCLTSIERIMKGNRWQEGTNRNSKGCGANMRVTFLPLFCLRDSGLKFGRLASWVKLQAAITHAHPTALVASELTAIAVYKLATEDWSPETLLKELKRHCRNNGGYYDQRYLGDLWEFSNAESRYTYLERGVEECLAAIERVEQALLTPDYSTDPCLQTGAGWIAEEALATALLCFLLYPDDAVACLRRAANSSGDSDSIACIAGALSGAWLGVKAFPKDWVERIEYGTTFEEMIAYCNITDPEIQRKQSHENQYMAFFDLNAKVSFEGVDIEISEAEIRRLINRGNSFNWHGEGDPTSQLVERTVRFARRKWGAKLPRAKIIEMAAKILRQSPDRIESSLDWTANYMAWHEGGSPEEFHPYPKEKE